VQVTDSVFDAMRRLSVIGDNDPDMTIFQQPWWLEALSDNRYRAVSVGDDNAFLWWPYMQDRWWGFSLLGAPDMTHVLGPVIRLREAKAVSQASQRRRLIETAQAQLPRADGFQQVLSPEVAHAMDFHLAGFELEVGYTYRLDTKASTDVLWDGLKDKVRNKVRRARQGFTVHSDMPLMAFYQFYETNLGRLGRVNHHRADAYRRLDEALSRRDRHRILTAVDNETGRIAAAVMLIWDAGTLYHFRATYDRSIHVPGASSLLVWESIQLAARLGLTFDSDSFHGPPGALFMEAFGATPVQRLVIAKRTIALNAAQALSHRLPSRLQRSAPPVLVSTPRIADLATADPI
jgi:hypothetical protein